MKRTPFGGLILLVSMGLAMLGPIVTVILWAFAVKWRYPHLLPTEWGMKYWFAMLGRETVMTPVLTSLALTSLAWIFPSHQNAGLSSGAPVLVSVTVAIQISRPSYDLPIEVTETRSGYSFA